MHRTQGSFGESKSQRDEETKRRRDEETKRRGDEETKRQRDEEMKSQRDKERKRRGRFVLLLSAKCLLKLCLNAAMTLL